MAMSLQDFHDLVGEKFQQFYSASELVGGLVSEQAQLVKKAFDWHISLLTVAAQSKKPSAADFQEFLKPLAELVNKIQSLRDSNRRNELFEHLSAVHEGITAFSWVAVTPAPAPFIKEMSDTSQFWINKVLVAFKNKDPNHVAWGKAWIEFLQELQQFVRKHHTTGLVWNPNGTEAKASSLNASSSSAPAGIPAPPPPPPPEFFDDNSASAGTGPDSRAALFASINQGSNITSGLKKVSSDQMTHKNPSLRTSSVVTEKGSQPSAVAPKAAPVQKPPKFELQGRKWLIEHQINNNDLVVKDVEISQTVFVHKCKNSFLKVEGKVNTICLDQCENFSVIVDSLLSSLDVVHSKRINIQITGQVPQVTVAKVGNVQIYLSKDSLNCQLISSESTGMNISVPGSDDEYVEHPIPEQFKSVWNGKGFDTTPTENM